MSDDRAAEKITCVAAASRIVDTTRWLFVASFDNPHNPNVKDAVRQQFGELTFYLDIAPELCGAIFVAEDDSVISFYAASLLQYFFLRDGCEAKVFEFCKFTHHFFARRLDEVIARTR